MTNTEESRDLSERIAVLEERVNTMQADYTAAHERMRADMAKRDTEAAKRDIEAAKRDKANVQWLVGTVFAAALLIIAVLGFWLRFPLPSPSG